MSCDSLLVWLWLRWTPVMSLPGSEDIWQSVRVFLRRSRGVRGFQLYYPFGEPRRGKGCPTNPAPGDHKQACQHLRGVANECNFHSKSHKAVITSTSHIIQRWVTMTSGSRSHVIKHLTYHRLRGQGDAEPVRRLNLGAFAQISIVLCGSCSSWRSVGIVLPVYCNLISDSEPARCES